MGGLTIGGRLGRPASDAYWIKSSLSYANGNCVEVASLPGGEVGVRNSRHIEGPVLRFTPDEWHAFLGGARNGEFDSFGKVWPLGQKRHTILLRQAVDQNSGEGPSQALRGLPLRRAAVD